MKPIRITRQIAAPVDAVFATIASIEEFKKAIPHITEVEFLSEQRTGVGTRFRETRLMGKREASTVLEVTEYVENDRVRMVADSHGTIWDTVFTVEPGRAGTQLVMHMETRSHKLLAKLTTKLLRGMIAKAIEKDLNEVKRYCEGPDA